MEGRAEGEGGREEEERRRNTPGDSDRCCSGWQAESSLGRIGKRSEHTSSRLWCSPLRHSTVQMRQLLVYPSPPNWRRGVLAVKKKKEREKRGKQNYTH